jgi:DNA adenine methylase
LEFNKELIEIEPKPFLRWAGGKNWLVKHLRESLEDFTFKNYHEPFLGGASLFLFIKPQNKSYLSDLNTELIKTYSVVRDHITRLISELEKYRNNEKFYYSVREVKSKSRIKNAARFIYLNQTSFNGIYRVNLDGVYNVPYGYRSKKFLDAENLRLVSQALSKVELIAGDFESSIKKVNKGDLVFLDPPYTVSHNNNGFIKYNQKLFSIEDQYRLAECIKIIKQRGAHYILTNAAHKKIAEIFGSIDDKIELSRASLIGGANAQRGHISEYLFTNIKCLVT